MKKRPIPERVKAEVYMVFEYVTLSKVFKFTPEEIDGMDEFLKDYYLFMLREMDKDG